jgi:hypothetical protein
MGFIAKQSFYMANPRELCELNCILEDIKDEFIAIETLQKANNRGLLA